MITIYAALGVSTPSRTSGHNREHSNDECLLADQKRKRNKLRPTEQAAIKSAIDKSIVRVTPPVSAWQRYESLGNQRVQAMSGVGGHIPSSHVAPRCSAIDLGTDFEQHSANQLRGGKKHNPQHDTWNMRAAMAFARHQIRSFGSTDSPKTRSQVIEISCGNP